MDTTELARAEFVRGLELEALGTERLWCNTLMAAFGEAGLQLGSCYVVAGSIVSFSDRVAGQQKADLLNSTLLAQLAANRRCDRERETLNWYDVYRRVLWGVGWQSGTRSLPRTSVNAQAALAALSGIPVMPVRPTRPSSPGLPTRPRGPIGLSNSPFTKLSPTQPRFTADEAVLRILEKSGDERAAAATKASLEALRGLGDRDRRVVIFESSSHSSGRGNFQIVSAACGADLVIWMTLVAMFFTSDERVPRLLSHTFGRTGTQMFQASDTMALSPTDYDGVREQVIEQLGDQASAYIAEIPIGGQP